MQDLAQYISPLFTFIDNGDYTIYAVTKSSVLNIWNEKFASGFGEAFYDFDKLIQAIDWSDYKRSFIYDSDEAFQILDLTFN